MRLASFAFLTALVVVSPAQASDVDDMLIREVTAYVAATPAPVPKIDTPADVVRVWRDMTMVATMIQLHEAKALPDSMRPQIVRRLSAALGTLQTAVGHEDRHAALLADVALLYAKAAADYGKGKAPYTAVADARALLAGAGATSLAREVETKYAKPGAIIPPEASAAKW